MWLVHRSEKLTLDWNCLGFRVNYWLWVSCPLQLIAWIVLFFYPISFFRIDRILPLLNLVAGCYLFGLGILNSFDAAKSKRSFFAITFYLLATILWIQYWQFTESIAVCWAFLSNKNEFYVVKKSTLIKSMNNISNDDNDDENDDRMKSTDRLQEIA